MNTLISLLRGKCPRCRKGKVFTHKFYNPVNFDKTHLFCPVCKVKFEHETGFFWGAMYFSYALNTAFSFLISFILYIFFNDPPLEIYAIVIIFFVLLLTPLLLRFSRLLMMYFLAPYRKFDKTTQDL